jgi:hypothetical protein
LLSGPSKDDSETRAFSANSIRVSRLSVCTNRPDIRLQPP